MKNKKCPSPSGRVRRRRRVGGHENNPFNGHTFGIPTHDCPGGTLVVSWANEKCSESGRHDCKRPRPHDTPPMRTTPGWLDTRCTSPWCDYDKWHNCPPQCPRPTGQRRTTSSPRTACDHVRLAWTRRASQHCSNHCSLPYQHHQFRRPSWTEERVLEVDTNLVKTMYFYCEQNERKLVSTLPKSLHSCPQVNSNTLRRSILVGNNEGWIQLWEKTYLKNYFGWRWVDAYVNEWWIEWNIQRRLGKVLKCEDKDCSRYSRKTDEAKQNAVTGFFRILPPPPSFPFT